MDVIALVFPVFAVIVTGYLVARLNILPESVGAALIQFCFYVAIPALLFVIIAQEDIANLLNWPFIMAFGGSIGLVFLLILFAARLVFHANLGTATMTAMVSVASNTGIIGLPLLHTLFGQKAVVLAAIANVVVVALLLTQVLLLESAKPESTDSAFKHVKNALLNPVVLSTLLGLAYAITPLELPKIATDYFNVLGAAVAPCALFAVGMSIKPASLVKSGRIVFLTSGVKLIGLPIVAFAITRIMDLAPLVATSVVISAALPTAKNEFILAKQYHQAEDVAAETVSLTTAASVVTLVVWLIVLSHTFPHSFSL